MAEPYDTIEYLGVDKETMTNIMDGRDNWGGMVHAFEYLTVLSAVVQHWPEGETDEQ